MKGNAPLDCEEVLRHLFDYLDGAVDEELRRSMGAHLERCRSCFSRAQFETRLREHLRAIGTTTVPADVERRLRILLGSLAGD
jgi:anti-sigma factor (TIGR02949 family)